MAESTWHTVRSRHRQSAMQFWITFLFGPHHLHFSSFSSPLSPIRGSLTMFMMSHPSAVMRLVIVLGLFFLVLTFFAWSNPSYMSTSAIFSSSSSTTTSRQSDFAVHGCSPEDWASGSWQEKRDPVVVRTPEDGFAASGFLGCASNREVGWHLSTDHADLFDWRGNVSRWDWQGAGRCAVEVPNNRETMVIDLVENGGWLLIGGE